MSIYQQYIEYIQQRQEKSDEKLYKHRILPGHEGGKYTLQNTLLVTYQEHCLMHFYRFLSYQNPKDELAYRLMINQDSDAHFLKSSLGGQIGGKRSAVNHKKAQTQFYSKEWQKKYGFKGAGRKNVQSGHLQKLNEQLTKQERSQAGKRGGKAVTKQQFATQTGMFDPKASVQKRGNLKRWGIIIDNQRISYKRLSSDFIEYHIHYGTQKSYTNPPN